jgi:hypothetical protein
MCPACLTATAILVAKLTSAGGLTLYAARKLRARAKSDVATLPRSQEIYEPIKNRVR